VRLYFLFATAFDLPQEKVFVCRGGKIDDQFRNLHLAFKEQSRFLQMLRNA